MIFMVLDLSSEMLFFIFRILHLCFFNRKATKTIVVLIKFQMHFRQKTVISAPIEKTGAEIKDLLLKLRSEPLPAPQLIS